MYAPNRFVLRYDSSILIIKSSGNSSIRVASTRCCRRVVSRVETEHVPNTSLPSSVIHGNSSTTCALILSTTREGVNKLLLSTDGQWTAESPAPHLRGAPSSSSLHPTTAPPRHALPHRPVPPAQRPARRPPRRARRLLVLVRPYGSLVWAQRRPAGPALDRVHLLPEGGRTAR
jgi:hypothetical protein